MKHILFTLALLLSVATFSGVSNSAFAQSEEGTVAEEVAPEPVEIPSDDVGAGGGAIDEDGGVEVPPADEEGTSLLAKALMGLIAAAGAFAVAKILTAWSKVPSAVRKIFAPLAVFGVTMGANALSGTNMGTGEVVANSGMTVGVWSLIKNFLQMIGINFLNYGKGNEPSK